MQNEKIILKKLLDLYASQENIKIKYKIIKVGG